MTKQELNNGIKAIEIEANRQKHLLYEKYAVENATHKIGDIISDGTDTIRVKAIHYSVYNGDVTIFYYGPLLTKQGAPRKDAKKRAVFESATKNI